MKIDKLSKQVERISTKRGLIKESDDDSNAWKVKGVRQGIEEIVDVLPMCHIVKLVN